MQSKWAQEATGLLLESLDLLLLLLLLQLYHVAAEGIPRSNPTAVGTVLHKSLSTKSILLLAGAGGAAPHKGVSYAFAEKNTLKD